MSMTERGRITDVSESKVSQSEEYVLAAFSVFEAKAVKYQKYKTLKGLAKGVVDAMKAKADYISLRRVWLRRATS